MPVGAGDTACNVRVERTTGDLMFYIQRSGSLLVYGCEWNGDYLKFYADGKTYTHTSLTASASCIITLSLSRSTRRSVWHDPQTCSRRLHGS